MWTVGPNLPPSVQSPINVNKGPPGHTILGIIFTTIYECFPENRLFFLNDSLNKLNQRFSDLNEYLVCVCMSVS